MTGNLAEERGPLLIKKLWGPESFSNRTLKPEKLHMYRVSMKPSYTTGLSHIRRRHALIRKRMPFRSPASSPAEAPTGARGR